MGDESKVQFSIRIPKDLKRWIDLYSKRLGRSKSNLTCYILKEFRRQVEEKKTEVKIKVH